MIGTQKVTCKIEERERERERDRERERERERGVTVNAHKEHLSIAKGWEPSLSTSTHPKKPLSFDSGPNGNALPGLH